MDVGLFSKDKSADNLSIKQALLLSLVWILTAFAFNVGLYYSHGSVVALEFLASYLLEKGLSVDNVFVFYLIFEQFQVPERYQRRVLQWGKFPCSPQQSTHHLCRDYWGFGHARSFHYDWHTIVRKVPLCNLHIWRLACCNWSSLAG